MSRRIRGFLVKATMRAAVKTKPAFGSIEIKRVNVPRIASDEVLVELRIASICGTDMHIYEWDAWSQKRIQTPLVQGHEWAGEVAEVGGAGAGAEEGGDGGGGGASA